MRVVAISIRVSNPATDLPTLPEVAYVKSLGVCCDMLTSESTYTEKEAVSRPLLGSEVASCSLLARAQISKDISSGHPRLRILYTTPETLCGKLFLKYLKIVFEHGELNRLVVDEVRFSSRLPLGLRA